MAFSKYAPTFIQRTDHKVKIVRDTMTPPNFILKLEGEGIMSFDNNMEVCICLCLCGGDAICINFIMMSMFRIEKHSLLIFNHKYIRLGIYM